LGFAGRPCVPYSPIQRKLDIKSRFFLTSESGAGQEVREKDGGAVDLGEDGHDAVEVEVGGALGGGVGLEFVEEFADGFLGEGGDDVAQDE
jgi:hypothetical protein